MPRLSKEELFSRLTSFIGDNTSDEALSLLEDVGDTYTALEAAANGDGTDWKSKYESNDAAWRKKYYNRFMGGNSGESNGDCITDSVQIKKEVDFDDVFDE